MTNIKPTLSSRILRYLEANPKAGDTLEGIAQWWLDQQRIEDTVDQVAEVLKSLLEEGQINVYKSPSGVYYYKFKNPKEEQ